MALFRVSKWEYISDLRRPSGISAILVVILDRCSPEHSVAVLEDAGLIAKVLVTSTSAAMTALFIFRFHRMVGLNLAERRLRPLRQMPFGQGYPRLLEYRLSNAFELAALI
jgi:hypothetical protein